MWDGTGTVERVEGERDTEQITSTKTKTGRIHAQRRRGRR